MSRYSWRVTDINDKTITCVIEDNASLCCARDYIECALAAIALFAGIAVCAFLIAQLLTYALSLLPSAAGYALAGVSVVLLIALLAGGLAGLLKATDVISDRAWERRMARKTRK